VASPTQVSSAWAGAAAGPRDVSQGDLVTTDTLFRIMSMTKMPCTVAALQQVEQGNLDLDAPVASYCPEFAEIQVLTGFDGDTPVLRPPARQDGTWTSIGEVLNQEPDYWAGGHGLYGPPSDYIKFQRALLRGGELDGTSILRQSTVDEAFRNQIGGLDFPAEIPSADPASTCELNLGPGFKWGYGLLLNTSDIPGMRRAWSGAWAGLCNTHFWVDRSTGVCGSIYSNFLPFVTPEALTMYNDFERVLYASL
jgi:CubicO group peptidase (beta-lactamase class C family)